MRRKLAALRRTMGKRKQVEEEEEEIEGSTSENENENEEEGEEEVDVSDLAKILASKKETKDANEQFLRK